MDAHTPNSSTASALAPPLAALVETLLLAAQDLRVERPHNEAGQRFQSCVVDGQSQQEGDTAESEQADGAQALLDLRSHGSNAST